MNDLPPPMQTVWHSLLWKEWHEHKWKLVALTAICVAPLCLFGLGEPRSLLMGMFVILICYCALTGTFLGMSTAGRESGRNTLPFLQSLPVPLWQPGATKLTLAVVTAILPLLALVGVFCVWWSFLWFGDVDLQAVTMYCGANFQAWGISNWLVAITVGSALGVSSLLLWMAAMGVNRSDEIRAGAIGFLIICLVWFVLAYGFDLGERKNISSLKYGSEVLFAAAPGGVAFVGAEGSPKNYLSWWPHFLVAMFGHAGVLAWYLRRFGKVVPGTSCTEGKTLASAVKEHQHFAPPMRSQLIAVAWKQARETGPLALLAAGAVFLVATLIYLTYHRQMGNQEYGEVLGGITLMVCFFVTLVTGIGVFLEDLKPRVDGFWRSRPVNYQLWFGVKFVVGAVILVATFGLLMLLALWLTDGSLLRRGPHPVLTVCFFCLVLLLIYTLSMATYCVLRQPLYAAVLTIALLVGGMFVFSWADDYFLGDSWSGPVGLALLLLCQVVATTLAWQAVKRNWQIAAI